jgi:hypothetical protein
LSYKSAHGSLRVHWTPDVPHFLKTFEPLDGVEFVDDHSPGFHQDYGIAAGAPADWRKAYAEMRPVSSIVQRVATFRETLYLDGGYLAIHVRRTDMTPLAAMIGAHHETDEEYLRWCAARHGPVWVACDNGETQRRYQSWLGDRFRSGCVLDGKELHGLNEHKVYGRIEDAIVDMWMCRGAVDWMGQGFGTFSGTIRILRALDRGEVPT